MFYYWGGGDLGSGFGASGRGIEQKTQCSFFVKMYDG